MGVQQGVVLGGLGLVNHVLDPRFESCVLERLVKYLLLHVTNAILHAHNLRLFRRRLRKVLVCNQVLQLFGVLFCSWLEVFAWSLKQILTELRVHGLLNHKGLKRVARLHGFVAVAFTSVRFILIKVIERLNIDLLCIDGAAVLRIQVVKYCSFEHLPLDFLLVNHERVCCRAWLGLFAAGDIWPLLRKMACTGTGIVIFFRPC